MLCCKNLSTMADCRRRFQEDPLESCNCTAQLQFVCRQYGFRRSRYKSNFLYNRSIIVIIDEFTSKSEGVRKGPILFPSHHLFRHHQWPSIPHERRPFYSFVNDRPLHHSFFCTKGSSSNELHNRLCTVKSRRHTQKSECG